MRLPSYIVRHRLGVFHFRVRLPPNLHAATGLKVIKRSLGTKDPAQARAIAYHWGLKYANALANIKSGGAMTRETLEDLFPGVEWGSIRPFSVKAGPHGYDINTDGTPQDNAAAIEAIGKLPPIVSNVATAQRVNPLKLSEAIARYLAKIQPTSLKDTLEAKRDALLPFKLWKGDVAMSTIGASDLDEYRAFLQAKGNSLPTLRNKFTYLGQLFEWAMVAGYYPDGKNPAYGQVKYGNRQKRARQGFGWQPFTAAQLVAIFDPKHYARHKLPSEYWVPLIQLFTGARITEVCQLRTADFIRQDALDCFKITDQGEEEDSPEAIEKRTKTPGSVRTLPIHPLLERLGLLEYVEQRRLAGDAQIFPYLVDGANGVGDRQLKAFSRYLVRVGVKLKRKAKAKRLDGKPTPPPPKLGSLRIPLKMTVDSGRW